MEQIVMEISAMMDGAGGLGQGKLRVTTERLVFERKKMFGGVGDVTSFPLSSIQQAGLSGVIEKKLKVRAGSTEVTFKSGLMSTGDADLKAVSDLLQRSMAGYPLGSPVQAPGGPTQLPAAPEASAGMVVGDPLGTPMPPGAPPTSPTGWVEELERVARLHAAGALTDEEFAAAKAKLVS